jgi:hypothetical protein
MSGTKIYRVGYSNARAEIEALANRARDAERQRKALAIREESRRKAKEREAELQRVQKLKTREKLAQARLAAVQRLDDLIVSMEQKKLANENSLEAEQVPAKIPKITTVEQIEEDATESEQMLAIELAEKLATLVNWKSVFITDEEVRNFGGEDFKQWSEESDLLLTDVAWQQDKIAALKQVADLLDRAEVIQTKAGEVSNNFIARNVILQEIVASLKEIGFFVENPEFVDVNSPAGAVFVRASRGDQIMTAEIDLDRKVRSDWQGIGGEYCTDAFFEYAKSMSARGIDVVPENPDLKPKLIKKGEMDLPTNDQKSRGVS